MRRRGAIVLAVLGGILFITSRSAGADSPDPISDAQQKLDAGQFKDAITVVTQALTRTRPDDDSAQRAQLLTIKGEALLRMGQTATAASTFDMAVKSAPDVRTAALARANGLLIRAASQGKYRPKSGGAQPIDIIDPESRKQAFAALREDLSRTVKPKMQSTLNGKTLPPLLDVLPAVMDLGYLEYAATGSAPTARDDLKELGARARDLMNSELRKLRHQIDVLEEHRVVGGVVREIDVVLAEAVVYVPDLRIPGLADGARFVRDGHLVPEPVLDRREAPLGPRLRRLRP